MSPSVSHASHGSTNDRPPCVLVVVRGIGGGTFNEGERCGASIKNNGRRVRQNLAGCDFDCGCRRKVRLRKAVGASAGSQTAETWDSTSKSQSMRRAHDSRKARFPQGSCRISCEVAHATRNPNPSRLRPVARPGVRCGSVGHVRSVAYCCGIRERPETTGNMPDSRPGADSASPATGFERGIQPKGSDTIASAVAQHTTRACARSKSYSGVAQRPSPRRGLQGDGSQDGNELRAAAVSGTELGRIAPLVGASVGLIPRTRAGSIPAPGICCVRSQGSDIEERRPVGMQTPCDIGNSLSPRSNLTPAAVGGSRSCTPLTSDHESVERPCKDAVSGRPEVWCGNALRRRLVTHSRWADGLEPAHVQPFDSAPGDLFPVPQTQWRS